MHTSKIAKCTIPLYGSSPCPLYPLPTYQKDANVIMILEGSYNHLANSAGMG